MHIKQRLKKLLPTSGLWIPLFSLAAYCNAAPNYIASVIEFGEEIQDVSVTDLNGDGREDLIVSNWNKDLGRELWIYWQQSDGKFPAKPSRRIEVKGDIVAYAVADIRAEPGYELLLFTPLSIFSYSTTHDSYANNLQKICDWQFVNSVPSRRSTPFLGNFTDLNGDGSVDLLLPGKESFGVLALAPDSDNKTSQVIALPKAQHKQLDSDGEDNVHFNMQNGLKIEVSRPSNFEGLFVERLTDTKPSETESEFARYESPGNLLKLERWIDTVTTAQLIPGAALEYIYYDEDPEIDHKIKKNHRLNIVAINASKPSVTARLLLEKRDAISLFDFNGDQLMDLLVSENQGSDNVSANLYINRAGKFNLEKADQVIKISGYDVSFQLSDINGDGRNDLVVNAYQISALDALRKGALMRVSLIFGANPNFAGAEDQPVFNRRPDFKLEENFSADDIKGLSAPLDFTLDIDGDGNKEAVAVDKRGALSARTINHGWQLQDNAMWDFVPYRYIAGVTSYSLNQDQQPDFILSHQDSITVLVSNQ